MVPSCKTCCASFGLIVAVLCIVITLRTLTLFVRTDDIIDCKISDDDFIKVDETRKERFRNGLRIPTISHDIGDYDTDALIALQKLIQTEYRLVHSSPIVTLEIVGNYSLLYTVQGTNSSLTPYLLASHLDVVPVKLDSWDYPPFGADIHDGFIYARGTIDVKLGVFGILESLEYLLSKGFQPSRTFYIAFGHDEEVSGYDGARSLSNRLKDKGLTRLEFLLDEGLNVIKGLVPGISKPVALVGTAEKGQVVLRLKVEGQTGHSSMPTKENALTILASAIYRLERNPHPSMFGYGPEKDMFVHLSSHMSFPMRVICSNLWLFGPLVAKFLSTKPSTNAVVRTVTSVTMFHIQEISCSYIYYIPSTNYTRAIYIIHSVQTIQEVSLAIEGGHIHPFIKPDTSVQLRLSADIPFREITHIVLVNLYISGVMIGNTDTNHYSRFTTNIYRFTPSFMYPEDLSRFHGNNERISIRNYEQAINFYYHLIKNVEKGLMTLHKHGEEL
ncbi:hypothetical protein LOTGIDRAFT_135972 [Lottia gigantea]|uniref:Uncharacterized protein n=1 Tax=Lottia gigantea TaxID=225164 RepID=V4AK30_LOTGI|nr:hypothetical protein LOTGIDRAFT_135972 [Lottia gigantea]ESP04554.1 hypothetical protein LOTGIDRAFT_135972 [Lottia gigantea]